MNNLQIKEYNNNRILTTKQIAEAYGVDTKHISKNFGRNKDKYQEGKHYFVLTGKEKAEFLNRGQIDDGSKKAENLYLWTEKGAFLHAKSLNTDKAWEMYDKLIDEYFRLSKPLTAVQMIELNSKGILELNNRVDSIEANVDKKFEDMPLFGAEMEAISKSVKKKAVEEAGGRDSKAYNNRSMCQSIHKDIYKQMHHEFGVGSYKEIKRKYFPAVKQFIEDYKLPIVLREEVMAINAQEALQL